MVTAEVTMPSPKPIKKEENKIIAMAETDFQDTPTLVEAADLSAKNLADAMGLVVAEPAKKRFKLTKVFASWVVNLDVYPGEDHDSLIARAMNEVATKRLVSLPPEPDHILEEIL
jgi:hypothetical protein